MRIPDLLARGTTYSFEFGPPRDEETEVRFWRVIDRLSRLNPSFVSVTYGAAGSTREGTRAVVRRLKDEVGWTTMPHLSCIAHSRDDIVGIMKDYQALGFENLLALRGDPPRDQPEIEPGDFRLAIEIVELAREHTNFAVGVAMHPEGHPHAASAADDRAHQAAKLRVADFGITQAVFDVSHYVGLVNDMARLGVETPIIAGVLPVMNLNQVRRMVELSGGVFPQSLATDLEAAGEDRAAARAIGVGFATRLARELIEAGAPGLHFYTLNLSQATRELFSNLGLDGT
ncbi:MAG: methylenetetrahydrofolate reductase [Dehalococcoidia bacterium]|mgnify:CR=1 FL=1|nr:methylenetetrahydrofolate reductase [Dehalococcoidia bacterium]